MKTSKQLLQAVQDYQGGKEDAFEALYEQSYRYLYACVMHVLKNEEAAQDILQETYLEIVKNIGALKHPQDFLSWAAVIANRKCFAYLKKNREFLTDDLDGISEEAADDTALIPEEIMQDREKQRLIREILDSLSDMQRLCVIGYYYNEQSIESIAQEFQIPSGTVKSHLSRARAKIRAAVEELDVKKGTRLYGLTPLMLLLLEEEVKACVVNPLPAAFAAGAGIKTAGNVSLPAKIKAIGTKLSAASKVKVAAASAVCAAGIATAAYFVGGQQTMQISEEMKAEFDEIMKICAEGDYEKLCELEYASVKHQEIYPGTYEIQYFDDNDLWQYDGENLKLDREHTGYGLGFNRKMLTYGYFEKGKASGRMVIFNVRIHEDGTLEDATGPDGLDCTEVNMYEVSIKDGVPEGMAVKSCYEIDSSVQSKLVCQITGMIQHGHSPDIWDETSEKFYFDGRIEYYERFYEPYTHVFYVKEGQIDPDRTKRKDGLWVDESGAPCGNFVSYIEPDEETKLFNLYLPRNLFDIQSVCDL